MITHQQPITKKQVATAAVAGAVIGAGAAVAATRALSDKKTRKKVGRALADAKDRLTMQLEKKAEEYKKEVLPHNGQKSLSKKTQRKRKN